MTSTAEFKNDFLADGSRRKALQAFGSVCALGSVTLTPWISDRQVFAATPTRADKQRFLSDPDFALLSRLTEVIIPKTDTAGAIEAGVPYFIDSMLAANLSGYYSDSVTALFADGFRMLDSETHAIYDKLFIELDDARQSSYLESLYDAVESEKIVGRKAQFLNTLKSLTVMGYYTSAEGLLKELAYKGGRPLSEFQDKCRTHGAQ